MKDREAWHADVHGIAKSKTRPSSGSSAGKESTCNARDPGLIPGSGRYPGEGNRLPTLVSGLENSMDPIVHGVAKSQT